MNDIFDMVLDAAMCMKRDEWREVLRWLVWAAIATMSFLALTDPLVDQAEPLRAEIARHGMIVGRDPELGSALAIAAMARYFFGGVRRRLQTVRAFHAQSKKTRHWARTAGSGHSVGAPRERDA